MEISLQTEDFYPENIIQNLQNSMKTSCGAMATFMGFVKDHSQASNVMTLEIEHFPEMSLSCLQEIAYKVSDKWDIDNIVIIHRYGLLKKGERIVFVGVTASSRYHACGAVDESMCEIKTKVPLWKKEHTDKGSYWVYT